MSVYRRSGAWEYKVELGRDPATGARSRRTKGGFATRKEAEAAEAKALLAVAEGTWVEPSRVTLAGFFDQWAAGVEVNLRPATVDKYRRDFDRYVRPRLGGMRLQALTPLHLNGLYAELLAGGGRNGRGLSPTTVGHVAALLHKMLSDAMRWGVTVRNVAQVADPPRQLRPGERTLTLWSGDEVARFLRAGEADRLHALWRLLAVTGSRRGEALGAQWSDLDLDRGRWEVRRSLGVVNGAPHVGSPKTATGRRSVALDPATVAALRAHRTRQVEERLLVGGGYRDAGWVFARPDGDHLHPNMVTRWFYVLAAGVGLPRIRLHDLRHSAVTAMLHAGIPVKVVSERVGHSSTSFTQDVYATALPHMQEDAAVRIAAAFDGRTE
jgi:integrase